MPRTEPHKHGKEKDSQSRGTSSKNSKSIGRSLQQACARPPSQNSSISSLHATKPNNRNNSKANKNCNYSKKAYDDDSSAADSTKGNEEDDNGDDEMNNEILYCGGDEEIVEAQADEDTVTVTEQLEMAVKRIRKLEYDHRQLCEVVAKMQRMMQQRMTNVKEKSSIELTDFIKSKIGTVVRNYMFASIKFLDDDMVESQGDVIFDKCLLECRIDKLETNCHTFNEIIKLARKFLNVHKCHVRKKLRLAAVGKLFNIVVD
jgi:ABC-type uncharacterized transport system involved in gliding motility auxiliary subunit